MGFTLGGVLLFYGASTLVWALLENHRKGGSRYEEGVAVLGGLFAISGLAILLAKFGLL